MLPLPVRELAVGMSGALVAVGVVVEACTFGGLEEEKTKDYH